MKAQRCAAANRSGPGMVSPELRNVSVALWRHDTAGVQCACMPEGGAPLRNAQPVSQLLAVAWAQWIAPVACSATHRTAHTISVPPR